MCNSPGWRQIPIFIGLYRSILKLAEINPKFKAKLQLGIEFGELGWWSPFDARMHEAFLGVSISCQLPAFLVASFHDPELRSLIPKRCGEEPFLWIPSLAGPVTGSPSLDRALEFS